MILAEALYSENTKSSTSPTIVSTINKYDIIILSINIVKMNRNY